MSPVRLIVPLLLGSILIPTRARAEDGPEARALAYLAREVPRWRPDNRCSSCHHDGDAARALHTAIRKGWLVAPGATAGTDRWLARPETWSDNGGDGPFSDKTLAQIEFTAATVAAVESGRIADPDRSIRTTAALRLAATQGGDGSWPIDDGGRVGSPATYGRPLATAMAIRSLWAIDPGTHREAIGRGEAWLRRLEPRDVVAASARRWALADDAAAGSTARRDHDLDLLTRAQGPSGGWGPFPTSGPEPFDTALALLALHELRDRPGVAAQIERGRAYLIREQTETGHWVETTRPPGGESLAQRVATTGWVVLALVTTHGD